MAMKFEAEASEALGPLAYNHLLEKFDFGVISRLQTQDMTDLMDNKVGGNFRRATESDKFVFDRAAFRQVFSDWYQVKSKEVTLNKLLQILENPNVDLNALATSLRAKASESDTMTPPEGDKTPTAMTLNVPEDTVINMNDGSSGKGETLNIGGVQIQINPQDSDRNTEARERLLPDVSCPKTSKEEENGPTGSSNPQQGRSSSSRCHTLQKFIEPTMNFVRSPMGIALRVFLLFLLGASVGALLGAGLGSSIFSPSVNADCPQTSSPSQGRMFMIGGNSSTPSPDIREIPSQSTCPQSQSSPPPLPTGLRGHFAAALSDRLLVGGGTDGGDHDARFIGQWSYHSNRSDQLVGQVSEHQH